MKRSTKSWPLIVIIFWGACLISCKNPYNGLSTAQKALMDSIVVELKSAKPGSGVFFSKNGSQVKTQGAITEALLRYLLRTKHLEPIDLTEAESMFKNEDAKIDAIQKNIPALAGGIETRSILISADSLKVFADSLIYYQLRDNSKTGARLVFASYPYDATSLSNQRKTGRATFFVVGTMDTKGNNKTFEWADQKDMTLMGGNLSLSVRNHGELCPDHCTSDNTVYR